MSMSALNFFAVSGLCIFTAAGFPVFSLALWTCAMLALPKGAGSMCLNTSFAGFLNSSAMVCSTVVSFSGGTSSRSFENSSQYSGGTRSGLWLSSCPSFMYAPPSSSIASLSLFGRSAGSSFSPLLNKGRYIEKPYVLSIPPSPCLFSILITYVILFTFSIISFLYTYFYWVFINCYGFYCIFLPPL